MLEIRDQIKYLYIMMRLLLLSNNHSSHNTPTDAITLSNIEYDYTIVLNVNKIYARDNHKSVTEYQYIFDDIRRKRLVLENTRLVNKHL